MHGWNLAVHLIEPRSNSQDRLCCITAICTALEYKLVACRTSSHSYPNGRASHNTLSRDGEWTLYSNNNNRNVLFVKSNMMHNILHFIVQMFPLARMKFSSIQDM